MMEIRDGHVQFPDREVCQVFLELPECPGCVEILSGIAGGVIRSCTLDKNLGPLILAVFRPVEELTVLSGNEVDGIPKRVTAGRDDFPPQVLRHLFDVVHHFFGFREDPLVYMLQEGTPDSPVWLPVMSHEGGMDVTLAIRSNLQVLALNLELSAYLREVIFLSHCFSAPGKSIRPLA
jgi:hypothetical protein